MAQVERKSGNLTKQQAVQCYALFLTISCAAFTYHFVHGVAYLMVTSITWIHKAYGKPGAVLASIGAVAAVALSLGLHNLTN